MLRDKISIARKNPKAYIKQHIETYLADPSTFTNDELMCLFAATSHYEYDDIFHQIDEQLIKKNALKQSQEFNFYYHLSQGAFNRTLHLHSESMEHLSKAYNAALKTEDLTLISRSLIFMSSSFGMSGDHSTAISYASRALKNIPNLKDPLIISELYLNYAILLDNSKKHHEAIDAFHLSINYFNKITDYQSYLNYCVALFKLGNAYLSVNDKANGKKYLNASIEISEKYDFYSYFINSLKDLSNFFISENELVKANNILSVFLEQQNKFAKIKALSVAEKHRRNIIPQLDKLHQLYDKNAQLNKEIKIIKSIITENNDLPYRNENLLFSIAEGLRKKEFIPFLQTKWSIKDQRITGAEILARWQTESGEIISPLTFIEAIENTDLIMSLTDQLLHITLEAVAPYIKKVDPDFKVAVNISPYQLANHDLKQFFELCCLTYGIKPKNIELEIVERIFIENDPKAIKQLSELSKMGFIISLDDFGAGYSSLACVVSLPIDTIKVDISLIRNIDSDPRSERLFRSIIAMVKELNITTIAEGIETAEHLSIIQQTDCDEGQGYFSDRPSPIGQCSWLNIE